MFRPTVTTTNRLAKSSRIDSLLIWSLRMTASVCAAIVLLIIFFVAAEARPALQQVGIGRWLSDDSWHPTSNQFNMVPMIVGTLAATAGSLVLTAPLGIGSALFLRFYSPVPVATVYRRVIELLAGVPSVVYGLWGLTVVVPLVAQISPLGQGQSLLAGIFILTIMTLPTVALTADSAIGSVPSETIRGAAALGLSRRAIAWTVALPVARAGVTTGIILQTVRALGETMAVLMICGNVVQVPRSVFHPIRTLTANIALEMGYADDRHRSMLFAGGLVLLAMVITLVLIAERVDRQNTPHASHA